ncbi:MAG: glycosyl hydrolase family 28 protein, partial [Isosphaeraceae bacterium]
MMMFEAPRASRRVIFTVGLLIVTFAMSSSVVQAGAVTCWKAPPSEPLSATYRVTVDGVSIPVYTARSVHGGDYAFALFDFNGTVKVAVTARNGAGLSHAIIRPRFVPVSSMIEGDSLTFVLDSPRKLSIEPSGINNPLLIFANRPETNPPKQGDPNVVYFGPGIHKPERISLKTGQTLYLAGGAVVKGAVIARKADHIRICGRGILDGTEWPWLKGPAGQFVGLHDC